MYAAIVLYGPSIVSVSFPGPRPVIAGTGCRVPGKETEVFRTRSTRTLDQVISQFPATDGVA